MTKTINNNLPKNNQVMKKYTLCITLRCNLSCRYCYINKRKASMSLDVADKVVDFMLSRSSVDETIDIGFFGGEPLLEFGLIKAITEMIEKHPGFDPDRVKLSVVTNGTIFSSEIEAYLRKHGIVFCLSCDGPPEVQDRFRRFPDGRGSSAFVERTIRQALEAFPLVLVNAVYHPQTVHHLPDVVAYLSGLGVRQIYLNPDFSAPWTKGEADALYDVYRKVSELYEDYYLRGEPHFISLIDSKIAVMLRKGYQPLERCQMGKREFAFTPEGRIYPCERLVGDGIQEDHCMGDIFGGLDEDRLPCASGPMPSTNVECQSCSLADYCMNWCGCSNYFSTGKYNQSGPLLCASERAAIRVAYEVFQSLEHKLGGIFTEHLAGFPSLPSRVARLKNIFTPE
jgi:uncharacterized protein